MAGKIHGITVEIGGNTTKLGKALTDVNKKSRDLQSELNAVEKALKFNPGNADLIAQKQEILAQLVGQTSEKLETLQDVYDQVDKQFKNGEIPDEDFRAFQREIIKTEGKLKDLEGKLNDTDDDLEEVGEGAEDAGDGFTIMGGAMAEVIGDAISGMISGIGDLIGQLFELSEATEEYRQMQGKLAGSADTFGYSTEFATGKYKEFYKYLKDDQASTNAITNLMGIGAETETISKLAEGATSVWASYGDSIPIEGLTEAINETITVGKVTGGMADTINWAKNANEGLNKALGGNKKAQKAFNNALKEGLPVEDAFNEALAKITDEQERADVVAKFLNETYGESKKTYDEMNKSILDANEAELKLKETQAKLGETMQPINTAFTNLKNQALEAITPLVEKLAQNFLDLYNYMREHPALLQIITGVIVALATAFGVLAGALAIQGIITGVQKAFALLNSTLLANPITLIIALLAGLVAGFIYLWNNCDEFREFWINLWKKIKATFNTFVNWLKPKFETIKGFFTSLWKKIKEVWKSITNSLKPLVKSVTDAFKEAWKLIQTLWEPVKPFFKGIWDFIKSVFSVAKTVLGTYFKNAWLFIKLTWSVATSFFKTIWNNIKAVFSVVKTVLGNAFKTAWVAIKATWSVASGFFRTVWNTIAKIFSVVRKVLTGDFKGAWNGIKGIVKTWASYFRSVWDNIKKVFSSVKSFFKNTFKSAWTAVKNVFSGWGSFFSGLWDKIKNTFSKIGTNIANAISGSVKSGINGVISMIQGTINSGINMINGAIGAINKIPGVEIGKFSHVHLPRLARGGIVDRPTTALIGEDGREAVIPLEKNTEWTRQVAKELNANFAPNNVELLNKLDDIYNRLDRLQIVLDTGKLIGETVDSFDKALSNRRTQLARGW